MKNDPFELFSIQNRKNLKKENFLIYKALSDLLIIIFHKIKYILASC